MGASMRPGIALLALVACQGASTSTPDAARPTDARAAPDARDAAVTRDTGMDAQPDVASAPQCTLAAPSPPDWRLVTDGPLLRDGLGRIVFLRGVDAGGRSKFAPYVPFDYPDAGYSGALDAYMARAQSWGIDAMRVPFTWATFEPTLTTPPTYDMVWLARYTALLQAAWQHGIYTVVDFHQDVFSEVFCGDGFPAWTIADAGPPAHDCPSWQLEYLTDPSVAAAFDAFWPPASPTMTGYFAVWDEMISQVSDMPGVIGFEAFNEPSAGSATASTFEATTLTSFFSAIAAEMNAKAPKALVFFDATALDGVTVTTNLGKPTGSNLVFAPHFYPIGTPSPAAVATSLGMWAGYATTWNLPVFVGEFGASNTEPTTLAYMQSVFAGLDTLGLGGTEWEYSVAAEEWNSESDSVVNGSGTEFPVAQALIRPFARAVAGTAISQSFDATTSEYTLSYTATSGITEVRLPARAYPKGFHVALTAGCADSTDAPGEILIQATAGAAVTLTVTAGS